jgi:hypothetical protein
VPRLVTRRVLIDLLAASSGVVGPKFGALVFQVAADQRDVMCRRVRSPTSRKRSTEVWSISSAR